MPIGADVRRLAAIMFTDIAGYTAMVQQDEADALRKVARHRNHLEEFTAQYQGQVIQFYGDGSLSIYDSVVDAVRCAIAMQRAYQQDEKVPVRVGIHLGDFVIKDGSVFGDGINIASRIQAEGTPGAILISEKVNGELINHSDINTVLLGSYSLKNVQDPVKIYAVVTPGVVVPNKKNNIAIRTKRSARYVIPLLAIGVTLLLTQYFRKSQDMEKLLQVERIAVPEFTDLTNDPEYRAVSKMAAHWITTELIETVHASVVSYQSAVENEQIAYASAGPQRFSNQTGAINVIEGTFMFPPGKSKDTLEFSAKILNLKSGEYLKVLDRVHCPSTDPMQCIQELSSVIMGFWESRNANVLKPPKYEAYKLYVEARHALHVDNVHAERLLRKCIELDPDFIDAYFRLLDLFYDEKYFSAAADLLSQMKIRFTNLTERQANYLLYHEADNQGRNVEAFNYFLKEYQIDPKDGHVNTEGMVLAGEYVNDPKKILEFFSQIDPDSLDLSKDTYFHYRFSFAIYAYQSIGKTKEARKLADKLRKHVQGRHAYQRLIEFYVMTNDTASANELLEEALKVVEPLYKPFLYLVAGRQAQLKGDRALRDYYARHSAIHSPDSSHALGRSYYLMDSLDRALEVYNLSFLKDSTNYRIYAETGVIYARKGEKEKAERMITKLESIKKPFDYGNTPYNQARIAANLGEKERALTLLRQSLSEGMKFFNSISFTEDIDLMMLHDDPEFEKLLKRL